MSGSETAARDEGNISHANDIVNTLPRDQSVNFYIALKPYNYNSIKRYNYNFCSRPVSSWAGAKFVNPSFGSSQPKVYVDWYQ